MAFGEGIDEFVWGISDEISKDKQWVRDEFGAIEQDFSALNMTEWKQESWNERSRNFTWFYRFVFFALPYLVLDAFFQVVNLYFNTFAHHMWGNGNVILIFNTLVSLVQGLTSFLLVAEEPTYMSMLKPVRRFSFAMAACYNFFYLWGGSEFLVSY